MNKPFRNLLRAARMARAKPLSAALLIQRTILSTNRKRKRTKTPTKPAKRPAPLQKASRAVRPAPGPSSRDVSELALEI
jgi:hypothetical protein